MLSEWTVFCASYDEEMKGESVEKWLNVAFYSDTSFHYSGFNLSFVHREGIFSFCYYCLLADSCASDIAFPILLTVII